MMDPPGKGRPRLRVARRTRALRHDGCVIRLHPALLQSHCGIGNDATFVRRQLLRSPHVSTFSRVPCFILVHPLEKLPHRFACRVAPAHDLDLRGHPRELVLFLTLLPENHAQRPELGLLDGRHGPTLARQPSAGQGHRLRLVKSEQERTSDARSAPRSSQWLAHEALPGHTRRPSSNLCYRLISLIKNRA